MTGGKLGLTSNTVWRAPVEGIGDQRREELVDLLIDKIENLRPRLLDLSRRNPLIATKLGPRSGSAIRVVDELPDVLSYNLLNDQRMRFVPLPALDEDPRDEQSRTFQSALSEARLTDEMYLEAQEAIDPDSEDVLEQTKQIERSLKDRVREHLGMPPHSTTQEISISQHAKNNGVSPSYDLPLPHQEHEDGRHTDDDIQTLLLPDDLERKLRNVLSKSRSWAQETGINVLHAAFGFLEWKEQEGQDSCFAPLVLAEVEIERVKTREGLEFWVKGLGENVETNLVLAEKLRIDFGTELPLFEGGSIEEYLRQIEEVAPTSLEARVRRQVVFGVFPSARMAMYHDLNTNSHSFEENEIVESLFVGSDDDVASPFADEYQVDEPSVEAKVPQLVLDADSSQFSTLVDVADGRNLALEGPPGTGKSQTIVNAIAAALADGKKVLFIAEKMAALEVVRSRLEAVGLGEFVLPLQADRASRPQVIESLRARIDMMPPADEKDYDTKTESYRKYRADLARYVEVLSTEFGNAGLTVYEILGRSIATDDALSALPNDIQNLVIKDIEGFSASDYQQVREAAERLSAAWDKTATAENYWRDHSLPHLDRFLVEEVIQLARKAADAYRDADKEYQDLRRYGFEGESGEEELQVLSQTLDALTDYAATVDAGLLKKLVNPDSLLAARNFSADCGAYQQNIEELEKRIAEPVDPAWDDKLNQVLQICSARGFHAVDIDELNAGAEEARISLSSLSQLADQLRPFLNAAPDWTEQSLPTIKKAKSVLFDTSREVLAIRDEGIAEPQTALLIRQAQELGTRAKGALDELKEVIALSGPENPDELRRYAATISQSGNFGFLSSRFRTAKKAYKALSLRAKYQKDQAASDFRALAEALEQRDRFSSLPDLPSLFGDHFQGLDTNFDLFVELVEFYERIESDLPGVDLRDVRRLMRTDGLETLLSVPELSAGDWDGDFDELEAEILRLTSEQETIDTSIGQLSSLLEDVGPEFPKSLSAVRELMSECKKLRGEKARLGALADIQELLGEKFAGGETDTDGLQNEFYVATKISDLPSDWHLAVVLLFEAGHILQCLASAKRVVAAAEAARAVLVELSEKVGLPTEHFTKDADFDAAHRFLNGAVNDTDGLYGFAEFVAAKQVYAECGLPDLVDQLVAYDVDGIDLAQVTEALIARNLSRRVFQEFGPVLSEYNGDRLDDLRRRLASTDKQLIQMARNHLRGRIHRAANPPSGNRVGRKSTWSEMSLIDNEINKKKQFVAIRDLTSRAGKALQELKPCWMMSPLAVAQYLKRGDIDFDLCIIDEASQMPPEDAVGALTRCNQALVVGDTNQLPPTSFFRRMIDDEDADEDETVLDESILEMANAAFRPKRRLRWHYRSRHSGLIKFSNRLVYDDNLIVFPSANENRKDMGVSYVKVDGSYKAGVNGPEATAMIDAILEFMYREPDRSLGVVTLNQKQRDLITEELEYALRKSPWANTYIDNWNVRNDGLESFFVKNLENVQGDERDVIFIGTVYGAEAPGGPVMQRFGPINGLAGRRRLNVLFSRAKEQIVTFSSMTAADIRADEFGNAGTYMLKRWLEYSATGVLEAGSETSREPGSEFEEFVIDQIRSMGCEAVPQVGVAGYFVDIGVKHPEWPHGFILGVECDGASYHSSISARDRDRLRQEVLENLGWRFHRIWSTDWFNDPQKEATRLRERISERLTNLQSNAGEFEQQQFAKETTLEVSVPEPDPVPHEVISSSPEVELANPDGVTVGDTVTVRYLSGSQSTLTLEVSDKINDPDNGLVGPDSPLGEALLGVEEGEEIEFLAGNYIRRILVESVVKAEAATEAPVRNRDEEAYFQPEPRLPLKTASVQEGATAFQPPTHGPTTTSGLSADRFYDDDYLFVIRRLAVELIDESGPITYRHLSERVARAHGFQRTGSRIRKRVWAAVSKERKPAKGPNGENIFWPDGMPPTRQMPFRGLAVGSDERTWRQVPHPEKLGLAAEIIATTSSGDKIEKMARRIGLGRITQRVRDELNELLHEATNHGER